MTSQLYCTKYVVLSLQISSPWMETKERENPTKCTKSPDTVIGDTSNYSFKLGINGYENRQAKANKIKIC